MSKDYDYTAGRGDILYPGSGCGCTYAFTYGKNVGQRAYSCPTHMAADGKRPLYRPPFRRRMTAEEWEIERARLRISDDV